MNFRTAVSSESIRVIRVFLASPSDLANERRAARAAIDEINRTVARPAGFHVDLIGWEDTLSTAGRPQEVINDGLQTCQMFIGMLWARWGTPPDRVGRFSSGFEEEFHLASERNVVDGEPHITLLFKDVESSKLADPGPELSKVVSFKQRIIDQKSILFDTFSDADGFAHKVRVSVADYINRIERSSSTKRTEASSNQPSVEVPTATTGQTISTNGENLEAEFLLAVGGQIAAGKSHDCLASRLHVFATLLSRLPAPTTTKPRLRHTIPI